LNVDRNRIKEGATDPFDEVQGIQIFVFLTFARRQDLTRCGLPET
jgi:hypothetical protein